MLKDRVLTAVIGLPLILLLMYFGGIPFAVVIFAASVIGLFEYMRCLGLEKSPLFVVCAVMSAAAFLLTELFGKEYLFVCSICCILLLSAAMVIKFDRIRFEHVTASFLGFVYIPVILALFVLLREKSLYYVIFVLIAAWGSDTCAYFAGRAFGKHRMAPVLSPKKTWEGFAGGILGAVVLAIVFALIFREKLSLLPAPILSVSLVTAVASVAGVAGDLFASAIKRTFGIKDYGKIFPGHGGMMDRIDSMIFCTPVIYFAFEVLEKLH